MNWQVMTVMLYSDGLLRTENDGETEKGCHKQNTTDERWKSVKNCQNLQFHTSSNIVQRAYVHIVKCSSQSSHEYRTKSLSDLTAIFQVDLV